MIEEKHTTRQPAMTNTDLAFERTVMAESRTLMAWIRTAISLISFGFTIYKFFHETMGVTHRLFSPRNVGMFMIGIGLLSLSWGLVEHRIVIKKLRESYSGIKQSRSVWLAMLVLLFGLALFFGTLFRQ